MNATVVPNIKQAQATGIVCVALEIHLWSGRKRLRKENLLAKNPELAHLPPESLATLGSIKIADPDDLAPFLKYKREAEKLLKLNGLPLLGTVGIPEGKVDRVYKGLLEIKQKFDEHAQKLYRDFDARITDWRERIDNQAWQHLITDIPTPEYVAGRLAFGFHLCRVSAPSTDEFSEVNKHYGHQITGLKGELFDEAAEEARTLMEKYLMGKDAHGAVRKREKITQKTLGPLRRIGAKFKSFSFLDHTVEPLAQIVDHVLGILPQEGPIEGVHLMHVWTLAKTLSNSATALQAAHLVMDSGAANLAFEALLVSAPEQVTSPAQQASGPAPESVAKQSTAQEADTALDEQVPVQQPIANDGFEPEFVGLF
jgi:hypothetical protein